MRWNHWTGLFTAVFIVSLGTPAEAGKTTFKYGGYVKMDALSTYYRNGDVAPDSPLRDIHLASQIPVGMTDENYDLDFHVKESRFNLETVTILEDREIKGFLEMDFLLSKQGDEKVSNSFNPRLRHFYLATGPWLFGQTWTTFMIVVLPDDLDFSGAPEGIVFGRQPQVRFTHGPWQLSLENPETTVTPHGGGPGFVTESGRMPDIVGRRNFNGDWGSLGMAAIGRQLHYQNPATGREDRQPGWGVTAGTEIKVGEKDDLKAQVTAGQGLGRYLALNFVNSGVVDTTKSEVETIGTYNGWIGYRHFWNDRWRSSVNASFFLADNEASLTGGKVNKAAQSYSINLLYSPAAELTMGVEYIHALRELEDGTDGTMDRLQFSARYNFGYSPE